jgi:hypothetical protein
MFINRKEQGNSMNTNGVTSINETAANHLRVLQAKAMIKLKRRPSYEELILLISEDQIK